MTKKSRGSGWHGESGRHRMAQMGIKTIDGKGGKVRVQEYMRSGNVRYHEPLGASGVAVDGLMGRLSPVGQKFLMASGEAMGSEEQLTSSLHNDNAQTVEDVKAEKKQFEEAEKQAKAEEKQAHADFKKAEKELAKAEKQIKKEDKVAQVQEKLALVEAETKLAQAKARKTEAQAERVGALFKPVGSAVGSAVVSGAKAVSLLRGDQAKPSPPARAGAGARAGAKASPKGVSSDKTNKIQDALSKHSKATREGIATDIGGDSVPKAEADITFDEITAYKSGMTVDADVIMNIAENKKRLIELASYVEKDTEEIRMFRDETAHKNRAENEKLRKDFFAYEGDNTHKLERIYDSMIGSASSVDEPTKNAYRKKKAEILRDIEIKRAEARKNIAQNKYDVEWIDKRYGALKEVYSKLWKKAKEV